MVTNNGTHIVLVMTRTYYYQEIVITLVAGRQNMCF